MPDRRRALRALATAGAVFAVFEAQQVINGAITVVATLLFGQTMSIPDTLGGPTLLHNLVFAVGVFLALWLLVPIAREYPLMRVILRGVAISALATALVFVVAVLIGTYQAFIGPIGSMTGFEPHAAWSGLGEALLIAANYFAEGTPLVILAVVLLWIWLRRRARVTDV
jgi:hypothetical protein